MPTAHASATAQVVHVACLCAAWCRLCDDWRGVQQQVAASFAAEGAPLRWHWIDIEDEADLLGEVDVETFPTVVVLGANGVVRFAGPLQPQAEVLRRVLRSCIDRADANADADAGAGAGAGANAPAKPVDPALQALAARLPSRVGP
ncbi:MAG: thioredoxin [Rubrivivax sp.]